VNGAVEEHSSEQQEALLSVGAREYFFDCARSECSCLKVSARNSMKQHETHPRALRAISTGVLSTLPHLPVLPCKPLTVPSGRALIDMVLRVACLPLLL
jgi:hypothetical protein